jgi:D-lactate dehydrogenase (cytochrome)
MPVQILSDPQIIQPYLIDESKVTGQAQSISFPECEAEIREVLLTVRQAHQTLTMQGARTGITGGAVPTGGHILNLSKLNRITGMGWDAERKCFLLSVQPGVQLNQLNKAIAEKSFDTTGWSAQAQSALRRFQQSGAWFLPADITETTASIGGMVSTNASGAKSYRYGSMRQHVLGLRLLLANGKSLSLRRGEQFAQGRQFALRLDDGSQITGQLPAYRMPQVKNASGYYVHENMDLIDLFIGSEGTLGIVTEVTLALALQPNFTWEMMAFFTSEQNALAYVHALRALPQAEQPAAIEFFDQACLALIRSEQEQLHAHQNIPALSPAAQSAIYTEFTSESLIDRDEAINRVADLLNAGGGDEQATWLALSRQDLEKLVAFRHAIPESINRIIAERKRQHPNLTKLGSDMAVPNDKLDWVMKLYEETLTQTGLEALKFGHIGDNHLHVNILPHNESEYAQGKQLFEHWAREVVAAGGTVSAEHGIGKLKHALLAELYGAPALDEMRALKRCFDPQGLLNPGNMFSLEA